MKNTDGPKTNTDQGVFSAALYVYTDLISSQYLLHHSIQKKK